MLQNFSAEHKRVFPVFSWGTPLTFSVYFALGLWHWDLGLRPKPLAKSSPKSKIDRNVLLFKIIATTEKNKAAKKVNPV